VTRTRTFVCIGDKMLEFPDVTSAVDAALDLAAAHARVGVDVDPDGARRACARALPGMVCCPRTGPFGDVQCYPLTATTALVTATVRPAAVRHARPLHESCAR
jgi:hypothetical protein